jgi:hypothetical protein
MKVHTMRVGDGFDIGEEASIYLLEKSGHRAKLLIDTDHIINFVPDGLAGRHNTPGLAGARPRMEDQLVAA